VQLSVMPATFWEISRITFSAAGSPALQLTNGNMPSRLSIIQVPFLMFPNRPPQIWYPE
jgi:hypothetical protein